ncbi:MAG TPA: diaminopimelate epimerase [Gemmatimonadaceae bacterium]|nr:diaminopimelate epimerase [Gemmatimonadaceae bacterium]
MTAWRFYKMSGSGNDFVVFDDREEPVGAMATPAVIESLCARGTGVGADGVVFIEAPNGRDADFRMSYYNSDGSRAAMCGNASLCVTRLAADLGAGKREGMRFETDSGVLSARMVGALPEVDLPAVAEVRPTAEGVALEEGERRIGFALVGVPHLVVLRDSLEGLDVVGRGRPLRLHESLRPAGANVNFVAPGEGGSWRIRTYERGVEGETLACGTGAIATAILLSAWGDAGDVVTLVTHSERQVTVTLRRNGDRGNATWRPSLRGEGRLVFTGELADR